MLKLKEWIAKVSHWMYKTSKSTVSTASGSATVNSAQFYNLCSVQLSPNSQYLVFGNVATNSGATFETIADFTVTAGSPVNWYDFYGRTTTGSGQGTQAIAWMQTGASAVTLTLRCYGYNTTSHTETGRIVAIPLSYLGA